MAKQLKNPPPREAALLYRFYFRDLLSIESWNIAIEAKFSKEHL